MHMEDFCQHKLFGPHFFLGDFGPGGKSFWALTSWKGRKNEDPHKLFRGDFENLERGPNPDNKISDNKISKFVKFCQILLSCDFSHARKGT